MFLITKHRQEAQLIAQVQMAYWLKNVGITLGSEVRRHSPVHTDLLTEKRREMLFSAEVAVMPRRQPCVFMEAILLQPNSSHWN